MKNKKIILTILSVVLILVLSTVSFAAKTGMTFDEAVEASKERDKNTSTSVKEEKKETEKEVVKDETEEEVEEKEEPVKEEIDKETEIKEDEQEELTEDVDNKENEEIEEEAVVTFLDTISEDVNTIGEKVEYKSMHIDGNVHIVAEKVSLKDYKVDGNLFICATTVELDNVLIDGSSYIVAKSVKVDGQMTSAYILSESATITAFANIEKELRVASTDLEVEGSIGRDLYAYVDNFKLTDRAQIYGDCIVETTTVDLSEDAKINGEKKVTIVESSNEFLFSKQYIYNTIIANCVIVLIVAIFVLYSSPKFVAVNGKLRLRDFIKDFFTGILELALVIAIFIGLTYLGYGIGFGLALLILSLIFVYFGKTIFIISAGIRLAGKSENVSKIKSFFIILIVLAVVEAINLLQLLGVSGFVATVIINLILGVIGFGSFVRVVLAPTKKNKTVAPVASANNIREAKPEDFVMRGAPIKEDKKPEVVVEPKEDVNIDLQEEKVEKIEEVVEEKKVQKEKIKKTSKKDEVKEDKKEEVVEETKIEEASENKEEEKEEKE